MRYFATVFFAAVFFVASCVTVEDGKNSLVRLDDEPPGQNCERGGLAVHSGLDLNRNGVLDDGEITATGYVCSGQEGSSILVDTEEEPAGENCPEGGFAVSRGPDLDGDGTLDQEEIVSTVYVCNGHAGADTLMRTEPEPPGENCVFGGLAIRSGKDQDADGELDAGEVTSTGYVCEGESPGLTGVLEGNVTIRNSMDVALVSGYTEITGDLKIEADGLSAVSLPFLRKIGQDLQVWKIQYFSTM